MFNNTKYSNQYLFNINIYYMANSFSGIKQYGKTKGGAMARIGHSPLE